MFMLEWRKCSKEVILDTTCIIYTDSIFGLELLHSNVSGKNLKGIIIMQNKARIKTKAKTWLSIVKYKKASRVMNIVMVEDCDELGLLQISKRAQINKFALQFSYSLYD